MTDFYNKEIKENDKSLINEPLIYGTDIDDWQNQKWGKITFKINGAGNMVIEVSPALNPGYLPEGAKPGRAEKGTKYYNYDKKILYSMKFEECIEIIEFSKKRFDWDSTTGQPINLTTISPITFYRDTDMFKKTLSIAYNEVGDNNYLVNMNFNMTDCNGITTKIRIPASLENFETIVKYFESYVQNYYFIKYYNKVELKKDEKINMLLKENKEINTMLKDIKEELKKSKEGN